MIKKTAALLASVLVTQVSCFPVLPENSLIREIRNVQPDRI